MVKSREIDPEFKLAQHLASDGSPDSLEHLATLSVSARGAVATYRALGSVTGENAEHVIKYILSQCSHNDQLEQAVKTLSSLHTESAENAIVTIARTNAAIVATAMIALQEIGTETAADKILELSREKEFAVPQALRSLSELYQNDAQRFGPAYKQLLDFTLRPDILDRLIHPILDNVNELGKLQSAFNVVNMVGLLGEVEDVADYSEGPVGFASCAFDLAVKHAKLQRELETLQVERQGMMPILKQALE